MDEPVEPAKRVRKEIQAILEERVKRAEPVKPAKRARKEMPVRKEFWE
jgi:hypothetical protein